MIANFAEAAFDYALRAITEGLFFSVHMKIWVFNHYANTPDRQATRSYNLGRELLERGHEFQLNPGRNREP